MKIIFCTLLWSFSLIGFSQTNKGIAFQAIARTADGIIMPNKKMQIRISLLTDTLKELVVYQELKSITTSPLGLFTTLIGALEFGKLITYGDFEKLNWGNLTYFIRVEIDPDNRLQFIRIGQQQIHYVAYAFSADHVLANKIDGILSVAQGGTGVNNLSALKLALQLDKVNNIPDSIKILSKANLQALNNKLDKKDTASLSHRINQKIDKNGLTSSDIESSLGFLPIQQDYGAFFDTSRQMANINTASSVRWRDTISNKHIYIGNNTNQEPTRLKILKKGVYLIHYAIQVLNTQVANDEISIWIRHNGGALPHSLRQFLTGPIGNKNIFSGQAVINVGDDDYVELFFSVRNSQTQLVKTNSLSSPSRPATPSAQFFIARIH